MTKWEFLIKIKLTKKLTDFRKKTSTSDLCYLKGVRLLIWKKNLGGTFIQGSTFIWESRVLTVFLSKFGEKAQKKNWTS